MERAYREDELFGSTVIDSEGYIYGKVGKIKIEENSISLLVYETKPDERTVVNIGALKKELLKRTKLTFFTKLRKLSHLEVLTQNIQEELGLKPEEPQTDHHFIRYAERLGVEIPYAKVTEERREPKGIVTLRQVKSIEISTIGTGESSGVIKVILLHKPKEAMFRKIPVQETVPYRSTEMIKDKLVLDANGLVVGYVDSVVLFRNKPGIRVYTSKPTDFVSLHRLFTHLEEIGSPDIIEAIEKYFKIEGDTHADRLRMDDLEDFMMKTKLTFKVPEEVLHDRSVKGFVADIPWDVVQKMGDVVLLRLTLSELKSKG